MSLFNKKVQPKAEIPVLPEFPDAPENELPTYESTLEAIKREVGADSDIPEREPSRERRLPSINQETSQFQQVQDDKPVFVKLEHYKEALSELSDLKKRLDEAESLMQQLENLKKEEDLRLENWKHSIQSIKDRLLALDKGLFGA